MRVLPKGDDRSWKRSFYYAINRLFRHIEYENRAKINAECELRLKNLWIYGTTHPEMYEGAAPGEQAK